MFNCKRYIETSNTFWHLSFEENQFSQKTSTLKTVFLNNFYSLHPSFAIELALPVNRRQVHKLAVPLELCTVPRGSAVPRLKTTGLKQRLQ